MTDAPAETVNYWTGLRVDVVDFVSRIRHRARTLAAGPAIGIHLAANARVFIGATTLLTYATNWPDAFELFSPGGITAGAQVPHRRAVSLHEQLPTDRGSFLVVYVVAMAVAALFTVYGGRVVTIAHAVLYSSIVADGLVYAHGGDKLLRIVLPLMALTVTNTTRTLRRRPAPAPGTWTATVHNLGYALIVGQILTMYLWTTVWKVASRDWRNGTALGFILHTDDFSFFPPAATLAAHPIVSGLLTYGTALLQAAVVIGFLRRWRRYEIVIVFVLVMHVGIGVFMGLYDFALIVMSVDTFLLVGTVLDPDRRSERKPVDPRPVEPVAVEVTQ